MTTNNTTHDLSEKSVTTDCTQDSDISSLQNIVNDYRQGKIEKAVEADKIAREQIQQIMEHKNRHDSKHTPQETHIEGIDQVACNLIENGISSKKGYTTGIDLILDNGNTIAVRGASEKAGAIPLVQGTMRNLTATHVMIITNMREGKPLFYILKKSDAERISDKKHYRETGDNSWFIRHSDYRYYEDNYDVLRE